MQFLRKTEHQFSMTFKDINYKAKVFNRETNKTEERTIIGNVSGVAQSGQIAAIMGPSGAGKTSLLNFITNRIEFAPGTTHSGQMFINSKEITFKDVAFYSGYVMQDDILMDILTPFENLKFGCQLRKLVDNDRVDEVVNTFIEDLQLGGCKNTLVGNPDMKGISGGERKRTSIGMELISNPSILFLDEPTSGLDSQTSLKTINLLKKIAIEKNVLIICTIHQPSSNIFNLFDNLFVVDKGSLIYNGSPLDMPAYFHQANRPLNENSNPADSFMRILEENNQGKEPNYFIDYYKTRNDEVLSEIDKIIKEDKPNTLASKTTSAANFWEATGILSRRAAMNVFRNPLLLRMRLGFTVVFSFMVASVFWQLSPSSYGGVYGRVGYFFFMSINLFMSQVFGTILSFPIERAVFIREYSSHMYSVGPYYLAKNIVETPMITFFAVILLTITYWTTGLRDQNASYFFIFLAAYVLHTLVAQSLGYALGTLFSNVGQALGSVNILVMPFILFSGTLISEQSEPVWLSWLRFLSPMKYVNEIGNRNEFTDNPRITGPNPLPGLDYEVGIGNCFIIIACVMVALRFLGVVFLKRMIRKAG